MPIQIVKETERLVYKNDGSKIYYRRISSAKRGFIVKKNTKRGFVDWQAVSKEIMDYIVLGWDNVQDDGEVLPFDPESIAGLPDDVNLDLLDLSGGALALEQRETGPKNSKASSSGS